MIVPPRSQSEPEGPRSTGRVDAEELTWHSRVLWILSQVADVEPERQKEAVRRLAHSPTIVEEVLRVLEGSGDDSWIGPAIQPDDEPEPLQPGGAREKVPAGYKLGSLLGRGAMGEVWRAEQLEPVQRPVALKRMARVNAAGQWLDRFAHERQTLARLDHPSIARIFDAGTAPDGVPFLTMELVEGEPLTKYAARNGLTVEDRLRLMIAVCDAVEHAHRRGILHRDLKPANVLARDAEQPGQPPQIKVIDFGIAKSLTPKALGDVPAENVPATGLLSTAFGTPAYMAPEQIGDVAAADTRADVWSLGVMLYELLTGRRPFGNAMAGDEPMTLPSRCVRDLPTGEASTPIAPKWSPRLGAEIDRVCSAALARSPDDRYPSAAALAEDLRRVLVGKPLTVGPRTFKYRGGRWLLRNRGVAAALAAGVALLLGGTAATAWQAVRATDAEQQALASLNVAEEQRDEAERLRVEAEQARIEAERARRIAEESQRFLTDTLRSASTSSDLGRDLTVRDMVDQASKEIEAGEDEMDPLLAASVHSTLGAVYSSMTDNPSAERHKRRAYEIRLAQLGPDARETLQSGLSLSLALRFVSKNRQARELLAELEPRLAAYEQETGDRRLRLRQMVTVANLPVPQVTMRERVDASREAMEIARVMFARRPRELIDYVRLHASMLRRQGENDASLRFYEEAERLINELVEAGELEPAAPTRLNTLSSKAVLLRNMDRPGEAVALMEPLLPLINEVYDPSQYWPRQVHLRHAWSLLDMGRLDDAFELLRREIRLAARDNRPRWEWANAHVWLATDLLIFGRPEEALEVASAGLEASEQSGLEETMVHVMLGALRGIALLDLNRPDEAVPHLQGVALVTGERWIFPRGKLLVLTGKAESLRQQGDLRRARQVAAMGFAFNERQGTRVLPIAKRFQSLIDDLGVERPVPEPAGD